MREVHVIEDRSCRRGSEEYIPFIIIVSQESGDGLLNFRTPNVLCALSPSLHTYLHTHMGGNDSGQISKALVKW